MAKLCFLLPVHSPGAAQFPRPGPLSPGARASAYQLIVLENQNDYPLESSPSFCFPQALPQNRMSKKDSLERAVEREDWKLVGISIFQVPAVWH